MYALSVCYRGTGIWELVAASSSRERLQQVIDKKLQTYNADLVQDNEVEWDNAKIVPLIGCKEESEERCL